MFGFEDVNAQSVKPGLITYWSSRRTPCEQDPHEQRKAFILYLDERLVSRTTVGSV